MLQSLLHRLHLFVFAGIPMGLDDDNDHDHDNHKEDLETGKNDTRVHHPKKHRGTGQ